MMVEYHPMTIASLLIPDGKLVDARKNIGFPDQASNAWRRHLKELLWRGRWRSLRKLCTTNVPI